MHTEAQQLLRKLLGPFEDERCWTNYHCSIAFAHWYTYRDHLFHVKRFWLGLGIP